MNEQQSARTCIGCGVTFAAADDDAVRRWLGEDAVSYCNESCWAEHTMPTECRVCFGIVGQDCTCKQPATNEQPLTCANCHRVIVAEEGDTCASIPVSQRGRFDYCDQTVPERAPDGMLAVRVGSDPWTMVPLDNEQDTSAEGTTVVTPHFIAMSGVRGCLPDYVDVYDSAEGAAESLGSLFDLEPQQVRSLGNTGWLDLSNSVEYYGAEYAEIIGCNCDSPEDHDDN